MEIKAYARYIRMSPRKVRLIVDAIRGKNVSVARAQLTFMKKAAAEPVLKLLESAVANAKHNHQIAADTLFVKAITADGGPVLKRFTPKAFGRATPIRKRTTHLSIVLDEHEAGKAPAKPIKAKAAAKNKNSGLKAKSPAKPDQAPPGKTA